LAHTTLPRVFMVFRALSMVHPSEDEDPWGWNPVPDEVGDRDLLGVEVQRTLINL